MAWVFEVRSWPEGGLDRVGEHILLQAPAAVAALSATGAYRLRRVLGVSLRAWIASFGG